MNWTISNCIKAHEADVRSVSFIKNTNLIVTGSRDKTCHIYDLSSNQLVTVLQGHDSYVQTITVDPSENLIYTGCNDNKIRGYDYSEFKDENKSPRGPGQINPILTLTDHKDSVVAIDLDEKILVSASWDKSAKVFKKSGVRTEEKSVVSLEGHEAAIWDVKILTVRRQVLTASADKSINLWSLKGDIVMSFMGHTDCVRALCYFHEDDDGSFYSTGNDGSIRQWYLTDGSSGAVVPAHGSYRLFGKNRVKMNMGWFS